MTYDRFKNLTFEAFKLLAVDEHLSCYEKVGFPNEYRSGKEPIIFLDCLNKATNLLKEKQMVLEIGPGCSELAHALIDWCEQKQHQLILIDSKEMLNQLPEKPFIKKIPAFYPNDCTEFFKEYSGKIDVIGCYSVLQYIFAESNLFDFFDQSLGLLADKGQMLLGDIPNVSKRKRLLSSQTGQRYHQIHFPKEEAPVIDHYALEHKNIDDSIVFSLLMRARAAGFDAYVLPQAENLPMSNRREDLLFIKP